MTTRERRTLSARPHRWVAATALVLLLTGCALRGDAGADPTAPPPSSIAAAPGGTDGGDDGGAVVPQRAPTALSAQGREIIDASGEPVQLRGVNWMGLDTPVCAPGGLGVQPLGEILDQMRDAGFDTVRLPWSNECVETGSPTNIDVSLNPELDGASTLEVLDEVVRQAGERDLRVVLAHQRAGEEFQDLWYTTSYPEDQWLQDWRTLAQRYADEPAVVAADLHGEPHGAACWGCGEPAIDWRAAATRAGEAVLAEAPHWLVVVSGVETSATGQTSWWGSELADVRATPLELSVPDRVVYSVRDWPPSVADQEWFSSPDYPANLDAMWDARWGYLISEGLAPVLVSGFGSTLATGSDQQWLDTLVARLDRDRIGFAYWAWNPDEGLSGGLVEDDWTTPREAQREALAPLLD